MSDMKCPFCGELLEDGIAQINCSEVYKCPKCRNFANETIWQELIRTRKELEIARKALEYVKDAGLFVFAKIEAEKTLKQIEHKEI